MNIQAGSSITANHVHLAISKARYQHNQDIWLDSDRGVTVGKRGAITFYCHSTWGKFASGRHDNPEGYRAASWTAWGYVIAELFRVDPHAHIGHYASMAHFIDRCLDEHERYFLRQSLGVRGDTGADVSFLLLVTSPSDFPTGEWVKLA